MSKIRIMVLAGAMLAAAAVGIASERLLPVGSWGGTHLRLVVRQSDVSIEFDCAAGFIPARPIVAADGTFVATGTYAQERGGPIMPGQAPMPSFPTRYSGRVDGQVMEITVTSEAFGRPIGSFRVELGKPPLLEKCM